MADWPKAECRQPTSETNLKVRLLMHVDAIDKSHLAGAARHDQRLSANAIAEEAHAFEQRSVGHTGCGKDDVLAGSKIFGAVNLLGILDAHLFHSFFKLRLIHNQSRK